MSIVTRRGDDGTTRLYSGETVSKSDDRVEVVGVIDELLAVLGMARSLSPDSGFASEIRELQLDIVRICEEMSCAGSASCLVSIKPIVSADVTKIENKISALESEIKLPASFLLPGTTPCASTLEYARSIARRLERRVTVVRRDRGYVSINTAHFLNRISDYIFMLARRAELLAGASFDKKS